MQAIDNPRKKKEKMKRANRIKEKDKSFGNNKPCPRLHYFLMCATGPNKLTINNFYKLLVLMKSNELLIRF